VVVKRSGFAILIVRSSVQSKADQLKLRASLLQDADHIKDTESANKKRYRSACVSDAVPLCAHEKSAIAESLWPVSQIADAKLTLAVPERKTE
jgi:hypothetical protein